MRCLDLWSLPCTMAFPVWKMSASNPRRCLMPPEWLQPTRLGWGEAQLSCKQVTANAVPRPRWHPNATFATLYPLSCPALALQSGTPWVPPGEHPWHEGAALNTTLTTSPSLSPPSRQHDYHRHKWKHSQMLGCLHNRVKKKKKKKKVRPPWSQKLLA